MIWGRTYLRYFVVAAARCATCVCRRGSWNGGGGIFPMTKYSSLPSRHTVTQEPQLSLM